MGSCEWRKAGKEVGGQNAGAPLRLPALIFPQAPRSDARARRMRAARSTPNCLERAIRGKAKAYAMKGATPRHLTVAANTDSNVFFHSECR